MYNENFIQTNEHKKINSLNEEELICLLKEKNKLVEAIDLNESYFQTGYFIGLTRIANHSKVLYITPKLDDEKTRVDYLSMLSSCIKHPEILKIANDLFHIDFDKPTIKIKQQDDLLTPLLVIYFLQLTHAIVKKGLKKGYYRVEKNLNSSVKGKVLVSNTIKYNHLKSKYLHTYCSYEEYGVNNEENRILKKALLFIQRYLLIHDNINKEVSPILKYILPAFSKVDENISINEIRKVKHNPFFIEYAEGVDIAIKILKRFGFNINQIDKNEEVDLPPFWIDMTKLFEMYVLGKLKDAFGANEIIFQASGKYGDSDFLRTTTGKEMIIDAKYKRAYTTANYDINDIRQLSGYARDIGILTKLKIDKSKWNETIIKCLIIYPEQNENNFINSETIFDKPIYQFEEFYKLGISIPTIS